MIKFEEINIDQLQDNTDISPLGIICGGCCKDGIVCGLGCSGDNLGSWCGLNCPKG